MPCLGRSKDGRYGHPDDVGRGRAVTERVDVIVVSFNSSRYLRGAIDAVRAWPRTGRVIVVDNASADDSVDVAGSVADEVVKLDTNVGYGAAQNIGMNRARTEWALTLNPDAEVVPEGLESGHSVLTEEADVAMVQGVILRAADGKPERTHGREPGIADLVARRFRLRQRLGEDVLRRVAPLLGLGYFSDRVPVERVDTPFLAAVAPLVRRTSFDEVGGYDEGFFLYAEDVDLCHRLREREWRLVSVPDVWARHIGGASSSDRPVARDELWWRSHRRLIEQHWSGPRRAVGIALTRGRGGDRG